MLPIDKQILEKRHDLQKMVHKYGLKTIVEWINESVDGSSVPKMRGVHFKPLFEELKKDTNMKSLLVSNKYVKLTHFIASNVLKKARRVDHPSIEKVWKSPVLRMKMLQTTIPGLRLKTLDEKSMYRALRTYTRAPSPFGPRRARNIWLLLSKLCKGPFMGRVLDTSSGWGDRLIGAASLDLYYHGIEPSSGLHEVYSKIVSLTGAKCKICRGRSEETFCYPTKQVDVCFTSPPYFDTEIYHGVDTDWKSMDEYLSTFMLPTLRHMYKSTRRGGVVCINMAVKEGEFDWRRWWKKQCSELNSDPKIIKLPKRSNMKTKSLEYLFIMLKR